MFLSCVLVVVVVVGRTFESTKAAAAAIQKFIALRLPGRRGRNEETAVGCSCTKPRMNAAAFSPPFNLTLLTLYLVTPISYLFVR